MAANTYGRQVVVPLTNKSGGQVIAGDVVVVDTTNNDAFTTSTAGSVTGGVGVAQETIASNSTGRVAIGGYVALVNVNASVTRGNYGATHTVAKQATDAGAARIAGTFCQFLIGGTTPDAYIYQPDLGGASLTNPMTTVGDLIRGGSSGSPTRLAASSTAGQFLMNGGTATAPAWASRELDYVAITSSVNLTGTTEGTANTIITGTSLAYDGATIIVVEFMCGALGVQQTAGAFANILLYDGATILGIMAQARTPSGTSPNLTPVFATYRLTPTNASHQYIIKGTTSSGTSVVNAGAGGSGTNMPAYLRIIRAV